jgi:hypothetical protein
MTTITTITDKSNGQERDAHGRFTVKTTLKENDTSKDIDPPLVSLKITNPITYFKIWWKKIIGNEGIEIKLKIRPLTAVALSVAVISLSFGLGRISATDYFPYFVIESKPTSTNPIIIAYPTSSLSDLQDTAFTGTLRYSSVNRKYYLQTTSSEAISLSIKEDIDLTKYIGKKIIVMGKYDKDSRILYVDDVNNLELVAKTPTPTPNPSNAITP